MTLDDWQRLPWGEKRVVCDRILRSEEGELDHVLHVRVYREVMREITKSLNGLEKSWG